MTNVELGKTYRDIITGYSGICIGRCQYITGCDQALLVPPVNPDGVKYDGTWFDVQRLKDTGAEKIELDNGKISGSDIQAPIK